jgi:cytochrome c2
MRRRGALAASIAAVATLLPAVVLAQDARRGQHVFRQCALCHVVDPAAKDLVAPPLHNIIGRRAGLMQGFDYSEIMRLAGREGLFWTPEALFYFLDRPEEFMPGTYMAFSGLDEQERRDVIAYLERATQDWKQAEARQAKSSGSPPPPKPTPQRSSGAPRVQGIQRIP